MFETDYDSWHDESYTRSISVILFNNVLSHRCQGSIDGLFSNGTVIIVKLYPSLTEYSVF